jgi:hypothetical protein
VRLDAAATVAALLLLTGAHGPAAHYRVGAQSALLPDPEITPGAVLEGMAPAEICVAGYSARARHVTAARTARVYALYGVEPRAGVCCEVDHLISLELGGSNDLANLWPQPYAPRPGAHEKDVLENFLHRAVCSGAMTLEEAQAAIATDWPAAYQRMKGAP